MPNLNNLKKLLEKEGRGSQSKLAKSINVSTGNISDWFNPNKTAMPNASALCKIADYYNCSIDYLLGRTNQKEQQYSDKIIHLQDMGEIISIDTYVEKVSAGKGNVVITGDKVPKLYPSTSISSKADYCVIVSGDSMYPNFVDGDVLYVQNTEILHGELGVFLYNGESYFKKYHFQNGVEKLISLNNNYKPIFIENDTFLKQGKVIGRFRAD